MSRNVFISYYPFNTLDDVPKLDERQKIDEFAAKLDEAVENMLWAAGRMNLKDPLGFFAVPEYYFIKKREEGGGDVRVELYSEGERDELVRILRDMSKRCKHTVILPGSITWRRRARRPTRAHRKGKEVSLEFEGISSVPVCYGGKVLATYDKVMNDSTIDVYTDDTQFVPGTASPVFTVKNLKCGLEICGDFNEKNLAKATGAQTLDFEFMMSASNYHRFQDDMDGIPVRNGGYFLHVDQAPGKAKQYNGVWCVERGEGWHGRITSDASWHYDPWTGRTIDKDLLGIKSSVGHVIALTVEIHGTQTPPGDLIGEKAFAGLKLSQHTSEVSSPLNSANGQYAVKRTVTLSDASNSARKPNQIIQFSATGASVLPPTALTNSNGEASAVYTCNKNQPAKLIASFHGATTVVAAKVDWIGAGDITKMSVLRELPHPEIPTYFTPIV